MGRSVPARGERPVLHPQAATNWRVLRDDGAVAGAVNMAIDATLVEAVQRGASPVVRFYTWAPACLSLGRNQVARGIYDPDRAAAAGVDIVRRPTGGLAVLHDRELTYSVVAPLALFGGPRAAYGAINAALVHGLRSLGIEAEQAAGAPVRAPLSQAAEPCFQTPAAGEITARGRKLVGSAQRCERGVLLQHGSILLSGSQARVRDLMAERSDASVPDGSITLEELAGRVPALPALEAALRDGFEHLSGTRFAPGALDRTEADRVRDLTRHYRSETWTWRR